MPKRSISDVDWDKSFSGLQTKIHVGNKEVDRGICAGTNMKAVYLRTLSLLFQGSKGVKARQAAAPEQQYQESAVIPTAPNQPKYSQMILTADGKLSPSSEGQTIVTLMGTPTQCKSCSVIGALSTLEQCRYCEAFNCQGCLKQCLMCSGEYCSKCSMNVYTTEERSVCLSCAN